MIAHWTPAASELRAQMLYKRLKTACSGGLGCVLGSLGLVTLLLTTALSLRRLFDLC